MKTMQQNILSLAVIQSNPTVGDMAGNRLQAERLILQHHDADLVIFTECFLSGYPLQDLVLRPSFQGKVATELKQLAAFVKSLAGPAVLIGAPLSGTDLPYNAAYLLTPDGAMHVTQKCELPNNDVFDERRVFAHGRDPKPLQLGCWKLGVMICEDMWHGAVARALADEGADILISINGSPMEIDKQPIRIAHAQRRVRTTGLPLIYANMIGGQDELVFDGGSFAIDRQGRVIAEVPFEETVLRLTASQGYDGATSLETDQPLSTHTNYPDRLEAIYRAMVMGTRDYVRKNSVFRQVLLGVSGGIDSALVAAIAADALGGDAVVGLMLPSAYTGGESLALAEDLFRRLGCRNGTVAIGAIAAAFDAARDTVVESGLFGQDPDPSGLGLAGENAQSRARGGLMMNLTNAFPGTLQLTTGNKSENSVGYCTLYGDTAGCFNPIKDLYKSLVFEVCRWRNANHRPWMLGPSEPIPERIISRPPTAELKENQTDEQMLGDYDLLDAVLENLIEGLCDPAEAARRASQTLERPVDPAYTERIAGLVAKSEFKRRQTAPGVKLTSRSFGFGWRYPITNASSL
jgi:NAD+ synthase